LLWKASFWWVGVRIRSLCVAFWLRSQRVLTDLRTHLTDRRVAVCTRFGGSEEDYEHPEADWAGFRARIQRLNAAAPPVVSPVVAAGVPREWIKLSKLNRHGIKRKTSCAVC
jgi:hypothetical protein